MRGVGIYLADSTSGSFTVHALDYPQGKGLFKEGLRLSPPPNDPLRRAFDTLKPVIVNTEDRVDIHPEGYKNSCRRGIQEPLFCTARQSWPSTRGTGRWIHNGRCFLAGGGRIPQPGLGPNSLKTH